MELGKLSDRQRRILEFIQRFTREKGYPPTIREIGKAAGISSTSVVSYNLKKLVREGFLDRQSEVSRGIRLSREYQITFAPPEGMQRVPLLGPITAGEPIEVPAGDITLTDEADMIEVTQDMVGESEDVFALRVDGLSMIDAMVNDGDIIVLKRQETARDGEMVAVLLKERGETTLKRFYREGRRVRLQPANPYMDPILVDADNVQVQGRVLAVLRTL
jgi:repressor LexA